MFDGLCKVGLDNSFCPPNLTHFSLSLPFPVSYSFCGFLTSCLKIACTHTHTHSISNSPCIRVCFLWQPHKLSCQLNELYQEHILLSTDWFFIQILASVLSTHPTHWKSTFLLPTRRRLRRLRRQELIFAKVLLRYFEAKFLQRVSVSLSFSFINSFFVRSFPTWRVWLISRTCGKKQTMQILNFPSKIFMLQEISFLKIYYF